MVPINNDNNYSNVIIHKISMTYAILIIHIIFFQYQKYFIPVHCGFIDTTYSFSFTDLSDF